MYIQAEAIHPDCAIISEHLRAQEMCSQTRRSEAQNQTDHSGEFMCGSGGDGDADGAGLCVFVR